MLLQDVPVPLTQTQQQAATHNQSSLQLPPIGEVVRKYIVISYFIQFELHLFFVIMSISFALRYRSLSHTTLLYTIIIPSRI